MPTAHVLKASAETVHWGYFDAKLKPVMTIASGDTVTVTTISGGRDALPKQDSGLDILPEYAEVHSRHEKFGPHIMTGPIHVLDAKPGDSLEVRIGAIEFRQNWGYNLIRPLGGSIPEDFGSFARSIIIPLDIVAGVAHPPWGGSIPLSPFFGNIGTAPPVEWGRLSSVAPHAFGGNIDNKELVAGTTLFLPVFTPGALLSIGDGHGVQGDGEVCTTAIETALQGTFEIFLHKGQTITRPIAETPTHLITMAFDVDLDDAAKDAVREMIKLLGMRKGLSAADAYSFMSLACDLRVTQLVNGNKGIHAMMPKALLDL